MARWGPGVIGEKGGTTVDDRSRGGREIHGGHERRERRLFPESWCYPRRTPRSFLSLHATSGLYLSETYVFFLPLARSRHVRPSTFCPETPINPAQLKSQEYARDSARTGLIQLGGSRFADSVNVLCKSMPSSVSVASLATPALGFNVGEMSLPFSLLSGEILVGRREKIWLITNNR